MSVRIEGVLIADNGQVQAASGVPANAYAVNGRTITSAGRLCVQDLGAAAVPATAAFLRGIAFNSSDGRMYITTDAPAGASFIDAMAVRNDGALHVSTAAVGATDSNIGGWAVSPSGQVRMAII